MVVVAKAVPPKTKKQPLAVPAALAQRYKEVCKDRKVGRSMNDTTTRLVEWFIRQPPFVRTAATSDVDEGMEFAYITALRDLADDLEKKVTGEEISPPLEQAGQRSDEAGEMPHDADSSELPSVPPKPRGRTPARGR